ncbi:hypothetical protein [Krasilnikovia sp. MM14-A1004]|uniref:hypothetical protein n=1 Tax=Krasilnikovia sp. MM14-A1004 TaxID=3373541 RepID=UPI00399CE87F
MTVDRLLLAACLVVGAVVVAWPGMRATRNRLHPATRPTGRPHQHGAPEARIVRRLPGGGPVSVRHLVAPAARAWAATLAVHPVRALAVSAGAAVIAGWLLSGVVAGLTAAVYAGLGCRALTRAMARRHSAAAGARALDDLCALAADLRAGMPPPVSPVPVPAGSPAFVESRPGPSSAATEQRRLAELTDAVWRLAEHTGAPAADLVERLEADARAGARARASAAAQAAGARATALLLAALPLGGIALGYAIGADPLRVLLHTTLGAVCALGAAALQGAGLLWADRLTTGAVAR